MIQCHPEIVADTGQHIRRAIRVTFADKRGDGVQCIEQEVRIELVFQHAQLRVAEKLFRFEAFQRFTLGNFLCSQGRVLCVYRQLVFHDPVPVIFQRVITEGPGSEDDHGGKHPSAPVG